jgi:valyl-tRNA synthetase
MNVPPAAKLAASLRGASAASKARLAAHRDAILRLARLSSIEAADDASTKGAVQVVHDEATVVLPVADYVDLDQEKTRLAKEIDRIAGDIGKIEKKLGNASFVDKAPPEVVEEQRDRLAEAQVARARLSAALQRLEAL